MYRDYREKDVQFYYVYKAIQHPEINNYVAPVNIKERLMHIAEAKRQTGTEMPWICDSMDDAVKKAIRAAPNGEYVIDPEGKIVRKRFWSNPRTLRGDLEELVGPVENPTRISDLPVLFNVPKREVASGVVPRMTLPGGLRALKTDVEDDTEYPHYVKLRAEATMGVLSKKGSGKLYLGLYLDPLYKVHWNNRAGNVRVEIFAADGIKLSEKQLLGPEVKEDADVDPRQFLIDIERGDQKDPLEIDVHYVACDDAESFCLPVKQHYTVYFRRDSSGGSRPGIFMPGMFAKVLEMDKNGDGNLSIDELPENESTLYTSHMDYNQDDLIDADEIRRFMAMFNNGRGFDTPYDDGKKPEVDKENSDK